MVHIKMQAPLKKKKWYTLYLPIDAYFAPDICMINAIELSCVKLAE